MSIQKIAGAAKAATISGARSTVRTLLRMFSARILGLIIEESVTRLHQIGNNFITVRMRRKTCDVPTYAPIDAVGSRPFVHPAIVLQGPLLKADRFTLETVRHYRRFAPDSVVIVSTWNGESESALQELRDLGADVVVGERPTASGRMNVNLQVASTRRGLERARELGCSHVAKTRTDQRLYAVHQLAGLVEIAQGFPVIGHERPRERIVALSRLTSKYCPLFLSDMFMIGRTDDLLEYWSPGSDTRALTSEEYQAKAASISDLHEYAECSPEHFLTESYLRTIGASTDFSLENWWTLLAERFLIIDPAMLDLYWPKYRANEEAPEMSLEGQRLGTVMRFLDWLRLYQLHREGRKFSDYQFPTSPHDRLPSQLSATS